MQIDKPPSSQEDATPPVTSTPLGGDWLHEIKQWYFTGSRRSAQECQPVRFVASRTAQTLPDTTEAGIGDQQPESRA
jgi:hypothetical protein